MQNKTEMTSDDYGIAEVLDFWFGPLTPLGDTAENRHKLWFEGGEANDYKIREKFSELLSLASRGDLDAWAESAEGRVALIILLDQFSRNIHRGSSQAFAEDVKARELCYAGLENGQYQELPWSYKLFFLMPLEHGEAEKHQHEMLKQLKLLKSEVPEALKSATKDFLEFAQQHADVIAEFGRFPYRNEALGRETTAAEEYWLSNGAKRWGQ